MLRSNIWKLTGERTGSPCPRGLSSHRPALATGTTRPKVPLAPDYRGRSKHATWSLGTGPVGSELRCDNAFEEITHGSRFVAVDHWHPHSHYSAGLAARRLSLTRCVKQRSGARALIVCKAAVECPRFTSPLASAQAR